MNNETGPYRLRFSRCRFDTWKEDALNWCPAVDADDELSRIPTLEHFQVADDNSEIFSIVCKFIKNQPDVQFAYLDSCVFPKTMKFQKFKMQASGVDIGSSMLFASRIGFSGVAIFPTLNNDFSPIRELLSNATIMLACIVIYWRTFYTFHNRYLRESLHSSYRPDFICFACRNTVKPAAAVAAGLPGAARHSGQRGPHTCGPRNRGQRAQVHHWQECWHAAARLRWQWTLPSLGGHWGFDHRPHEPRDCV